MKKRTDYKCLVLNYMKEHANSYISRDSLLKDLGISKSRLSEVLKLLKADGYTILCPPRSGQIMLDTSSADHIMPTIQDKDIRKWLILLILTRYQSLTFNQILMKEMVMRDHFLDQWNLFHDPDSDAKAYDNANLIRNIRKNLSSIYSDEIQVSKDIVSVTAVRNALKELQEEGFVASVKHANTMYRLTQTAPFIIPISDENLYEFCMEYEETASSYTDIEPLNQAHHRIQKLINYEEESRRGMQFGRVNELAPEQIKSFETFMKHPYKTNLLRIESLIKGKVSTAVWATGLLYYSAETNSFYALGLNLISGKTESHRLDLMIQIETLPELHQEFHKEDYFHYYEELFSVAYEDTLHHVKILFENYGNVYKRFRDLCELRSQASIRPVKQQPTDCPYTYVYEDQLRGLHDFARYLRSFGSSVLAIAPPELVDQMKYTYNRLLDNYELYERDHKI